jgi:hypothetical protein
VDRKLYRVSLGKQPVDREDLDETNEASWPRGSDGKPNDPWSLQYYLPLENVTTGEVVIFCTSSFGGRQAVSDLCRDFARRLNKGQTALPVVQLAIKTMPTKKYGDVKRPHFEVVGWDDAATADVDILDTSIAAAIPIDKAAAEQHDEMDDEIPF